MLKLSALGAKAAPSALIGMLYRFLQNDHLVWKIFVRPTKVLVRYMGNVGESLLHPLQKNGDGFGGDLKTSKQSLELKLAPVRFVKIFGYFVLIIGDEGSR